ncbi:hypothetical protein [Hymenobacter cheonanensis]|uniref:hypothetical protein n=1 Tax=Hymenobacter sp. CA2-7 TaxID=3063993 RepID=UPI00272BFF95|nr:hypothetical protein [Hymenobacter sp. CA2-7]
MQSSLGKKPDVSNQAVPASAPSLLHAWGRSAAWALGCLGSCLWLNGWANAHGAASSGSEGLGELWVVALAVLVGAVLFHKQAYKAFQRVYLALGASRQPGHWPALAWLLLLGLLRAGWLLAGLLLVLGLLIKSGSSDVRWD